jgi:hypothetical protein
LVGIQSEEEVIDVEPVAVKATETLEDLNQQIVVKEVPKVDDIF